MNDDLDSIELGGDTPPLSFAQQATERRQAAERLALKRWRTRQGRIGQTIGLMNLARMNQQDTSGGEVSRDFNRPAPEVAEDAQQLLEELEADEDIAAEAEAIRAFVESGGEVNG